MYHRLLNILKSNSFFLFGARGTGKSTLINELFTPEETVFIDLLDYETVARFQANPNELSSILAQNKKGWCVIDEVQKVPQILDLVHSHIEDKKVKFALTGSSARKLKRGSANLLGGRAFLYRLFPLTHQELGADFDLEEVLNFGSLAKITEFKTPREKISFLRAYAEVYLKEEILVEQIVRNLPPFRRFLEISAAQDTEIINYSNIARDIKSDPKNVSGYYSILEDTLLGFFLEPYHTSIRKRQKNSPKFYWFDNGVKRILAGTIDTLAISKSFEYGTLFESFIVNEVHRLLTYSERSFKLSFLRVDDNQEIDLIVERPGFPTFLIEIKSTEFVNSNHTASLKNFLKDFGKSFAMVLSQDKVAKKIDGITCLHWIEGIKELGIKIPD